MNLRFENDAIRFRIDTRELDQLLASGSFGGATALPAGPFRYGIALTDGEAWELAGDVRSLQLRLPRLDVLGHKASLPSKQGLTRSLSANGVPVEVHFEVDAKSGRRG